MTKLTTSKAERLYDCQINTNYNKTLDTERYQGEVQVTKEHNNHCEKIKNVTNLNFGLQLMEVA